MLSQMLGWLRVNGTALGVGGGFAGIGIAYAWNGSEQYRMARTIRNGKFRPEEPMTFNEQFCVFDVASIQTKLKHNGMVALIGLQATGKTTTVQHVLYNADNPFYVKVDSDDVHGAIYRELRDNIWKLPWLADGLRVDAGKSHEKVVTEVFKMVTQQTGKQVQLGFDVDITTNQIDDRAGKVGEVVGIPNAKLPTAFNPRNFIKDVKYLCADAHVAAALFCSSEGLQFMSVSEPRLRKFTGRELSMDAAKRYLHHIGEKDISDEMLRQMPRTFSTLQEFAQSADKQAFCDEVMEQVKTNITKPEKHIVDLKGLFVKAVQSATIEITEVHKHCASEQQFIDLLVKPNIFGPAPGGKWRLQFDCTVVAAKATFGI